jgi:phthiodiolone/phenolphthiodiolone dimycocerosates ketoreductase
VLGLGAGEYANYGPYGVSCASPSTQLEFAAAQIRGLLDDPGPDQNGMVLGLRAHEGSPGPRLWLAAHGPRGFRTAGRYADGWIPNFLTLDAWHAGRDAVADAATQSGRDPAALSYGLSAQVVIQPTHEQAHRLLEHPVLKAFALLLPPEAYAAIGAEHPLGGGGLLHMIASRDGAAQLEAAERVPFRVIHDYMLHGTAAEVGAAVRGYEGLDHLIAWDPVPLADLSAARESAAGVVALARLLQEAS